MGVFEHMEEIVSRVTHAHFLDGGPTDEELDTHAREIIPPTLKNYVTGYNLSGNVLTYTVTDPVSRQELSLHAPGMCRTLNARLGRNAVARIRAQTSK
jgi:hypothetical protein